MSTSPSLEILYAEDDPDDRLLAEVAHRESGVTHPLIFVANGDEALEYLRRAGRYADRALPGLVLLDLNMPGLDGRETLRIIRADPFLRRIPVVMLTTSTAGVDIASSYDAGANSYIVKPSVFGDLVQLFDRLCGYWFETSSIAKEITS
jgi:two-component system response regulator